MFMWLKCTFTADFAKKIKATHAYYVITAKKKTPALNANNITAKVKFYTYFSRKQVLELFNKLFE